MPVRQNYPVCRRHLSKYRPEVKFVHLWLCQVALHEVHKLSSSSVITTCACLTLHSRRGAGDGGQAGVHHHEGVGGAHGEDGVQVLEVGHRVEVAGRVVLQLPDGDHQVRNLSGREKYVILIVCENETTCLALFSLIEFSVLDLYRLRDLDLISRNLCCEWASYSHQVLLQAVELFLGLPDLVLGQPVEGVPLVDHVVRQLLPRQVFVHPLDHVVQVGGQALVHPPRRSLLHHPVKQLPANLNQI